MYYLHNIIAIAYTTNVWYSIFSSERSDFPRFLVNFGGVSLSEIVRREGRREGGKFWEYFLIFTKFHEDITKILPATLSFLTSWHLPKDWPVYNYWRTHSPKNFMEGLTIISASKLGLEATTTVLAPGKNNFEFTSFTFTPLARLARVDCGFSSLLRSARVVSFRFEFKSWFIYSSSSWLHKDTHALIESDFVNAYVISINISI